MSSEMPAGEQLRLVRVRVEQRGVLVDRLEQVRERVTDALDVGVEARVRLEPLLGHHVGDRAEAAAGQQDLRDLEQQQRDGVVRVLGGRDLPDRDDEALHLVGDLDGEVAQVVDSRVGVGHGDVSRLFAVRRWSTRRRVVARCRASSHIE